jgi:DNA (cytosine-5)-methyltransferase 1
MKLLDLFCGAGGAGMGYHRAGFDVTGVDIAPQPRYPFTFIQGDALEYVCAHWQEYEVIHASPPCQRYSRITRVENRDNHPDLLEPTRKLLEIIGLPYVMENVELAPINTAIMLCGSMFGLKVYRHRLFESNKLLFQPSHIPHRDNTPRAGMGISDKGYISITSGGVRNLPAEWSPAAYKNMAMGIDWMTQAELTESIPPAYTEYIGKQLIRFVEKEAS